MGECIDSWLVFEADRQRRPAESLCAIFGVKPPFLTTLTPDHGDAGVNPPTTFDDAVAIYENLDKLRLASKKVVKFSLSPITSPKYCTKAETILNSISANNINKVRIRAL